jgi:hypothetical protein
MVRIRPRDDRRRGLGLAAIAVVVIALGALALGAFGGTFLDLPDWFGGGESDPAPRGSVTYKGQEARTASERFLVDIGDGEAVVEVKAKQNWDRHGWLIDGDFQSTNGTSSVSDPDDRGLPASLRVSVDYCADGMITRIRADDDGRVLAVEFEMGTIVVCDTTLEHTPANDAAFRQDDTPADFHGDFVSFVSRAAEITAAASACPRDELAEFRTGAYPDYVAEQLAEQYGLAVDDVEVAAGSIGTSDQAMRRELQEGIDRVVSLRDPDDPDVHYEGLSIQYLAGAGEAVDDSCYVDAGGRDLDELGEQAPDEADTG